MDEKKQEPVSDRKSIVYEILRFLALIEEKPVQLGSAKLFVRNVVHKQDIFRRDLRSGQPGQQAQGNKQREHQSGKPRKDPCEQPYTVPAFLNCLFIQEAFHLFSSSF